MHAHGAAQSTLPLHVAKKKIPCLDAAGALVTPEAPNGVKLEMFIFDSFPVAKKVRTLLQPSRSRSQPADLSRCIPPLSRRVPIPAQLVAFEVPRDECFAPVKNAPGSGKADSPDTARAMISHLNRRRLEAAGAKLPPAVAGELIEVSPLVSYQGEGLGAYKKKKLEVHPALLIE